MITNGHYLRSASAKYLADWMAANVEEREGETLSVRQYSFPSFDYRTGSTVGQSTWGIYRSGDTIRSQHGFLTTAEARSRAKTPLSYA